MRARPVERPVNKSHVRRLLGGRTSRVGRAGGRNVAVVRRRARVFEPEYPGVFRGIGVVPGDRKPIRTDG